MTLRLLLVTALFSSSLALGDDMRVGERFPPVLFPSLDNGTPTSVRDFEGRKLVLHVWASW